MEDPGSRRRLGGHGRRGVRRRRAGAAVVVAAAMLLATACSSAPTPGSDAAASASASRASFTGRFDVGGGRKIYLQCTGSGSPTVVLISGLRGAADYWDRPGQKQTTVYRGVSRFARVCAYDRPGTVQGDNAFSRSDPVAQPSSEKSAVADLHAVLAAAGVHGPYVLAAHSYGGFIARLYASTYPDEVVGMVLIDALSEGFQAAMTSQEWAEWVKSAVVPAADIAEYPGIERLDLDAVMSEIRAASPIRPMPLTVLSADRLYGPIWQSLIDSGQVPAGTPADLGAVIDRAARASQDYQAHLVPGAIHITETRSGHDIPLENPSLVISAIQGVETAAR